MYSRTEMTIHDLAKIIIEKAIQKGVVIALAESCTGGMICTALTNISGSSAVLDRGLVTYSNAAKKELLGVPDNILAKYGAVSAETASAMTRGALVNTSAASLAASVTGIAGPGGGSAEKPVGLVHFSCQKRGNIPVLEKHVFTGNRDEIRLKSSYTSLAMIFESMDS
ncbi:CinA family protein [Candidatus Puniceispirillum sp.]|nr:CinA family protein [Candidatus Puniceispirillum sp.]